MLQIKRFRVESKSSSIGQEGDFVLRLTLSSLCRLPVDSIQLAMRNLSIVERMQNSFKLQLHRHLWVICLRVSQGQEPSPGMTMHNRIRLANICLRRSKVKMSILRQEKKNFPNICLLTSLGEMQRAGNADLHVVSIMLLEGKRNCALNQNKSSGCYRSHVGSFASVSYQTFFNSRSALGHFLE